ncbi:MAG: glycerol-3-phosphate 1-O-acyltransferase PlsY [Candidatus Krumholzibacteriia bacterium]
MMGLLIVIAVGYIAGAVPFSYMAGKAFAGIDLREHGSGNLGASNSFRYLGPWVAILVLVADVAKGFAPAYFAPDLAAASEVPGHWLMLAAGFSAVIGHMFSLFVGFKGGKGVATTAGAFMALAPLVLLWAFVVFAIVLGATRIVSVASMSAAVALPVVVFVLDWFGFASYHWSLLALAAAITAVVLTKHRSNIRRLVAGQEPALQRQRK